MRDDVFVVNGSDMIVEFVVVFDSIGVNLMILDLDMVMFKILIHSHFDFTCF